MGESSSENKIPNAAAPPVAAPVTADFWRQIREHKVVQWGLAYLGAALAFAHGQELIGHAFDWPELVGRILIGLLALGFPVALTFAWYHGHQGLKRMAAGEMTIIALLILIGAGLLTVLVRPPGTLEAAQPLPASAKPTVPAVNANSIAVLPFDNMSGDAGQDYFCDGISEEILNALVRLPELKVIGRTSSFSFKGKNVDLRTIGEALGVANLVEGSVRRQGNQVRISAQLVRASDGVEMWSQSFDRDLSDILKVQEDIAQAIAAKLARNTLGATNAAPITNGPAYNRYLEGVALSRKGDIESMNRGVKALEEAVVLDPNLAPAWAALADDYGQQFLYNKNVTLAQARARVAAARKRALDLDPKSVRALLAKPGNNEMNNNWEERDAAFRSALASSPNDLAANSAYAGFLFSTGRMRQAILTAKLAYELDPLSSTAVAIYGYALYVGGGRRAEGKALLDQALALNAMNFVPRFLRMEILLGEGNIAAAVGDQRFLLKYAAFDEPERAFGTKMMALAGDKRALRDHVARGLELARAGKLHTDWMDLDRWAMAAGDPKLAAAAMREEDARPDTRFSFFWRWAPMFAPARAEPDFKFILEKHKLPDYWRAHGWPDFCGPVGAGDFECH
jgi:TolB-like protein/cytochrome c-type biogenesis protein CcmH/NrfG